MPFDSSMSRVNMDNMHHAVLITPADTIVAASGLRMLTHGSYYRPNHLLLEFYQIYTRLLLPPLKQEIYTVENNTALPIHLVLLFRKDN